MSKSKNSSQPSQEQFDFLHQPEASPSQKIPNRRPMKRKAEGAPKKKKVVKKAPGAFRTISEVAGELSVEQHVLRFWETKFSQVKPVKRGGGRRYYRPEDVALLKNIHFLLYTEGYTIKGVQKLLTSRRGNLNARVEEAKAQPKTPESESVDTPVRDNPISNAVKKNRAELEEMLAELKEMREMVE